MKTYDIEDALDDLEKLTYFFETLAKDRSDGGREYALVRTKLQEARFWAVMGHTLRDGE